jgi:hypothetical protein
MPCAERGNGIHTKRRKVNGKASKGGAARKDRKRTTRG